MAAATSQESVKIATLAKKVLNQARRIELELTENEKSIPEKTSAVPDRRSTDEAYWKLLSVLAHEKAVTRYSRIGPDLRRVLEGHRGTLENHLQVRNVLLTYKRGLEQPFERVSDARDAHTKNRQIDSLIQHWDALEWIEQVRGLIQKLPQREALSVKEYLTGKAPEHESLFTYSPWEIIQKAEKRISNDAFNARNPGQGSTMGQFRRNAIIKAGELLETVRGRLEVARVEGERIV